MMNMQNSFELERISLILLMNCNLRCKKCCVQAPYYAKKYNPSLAFIKAEIDRLFEIADTINFFSVEGGETLLRADFAEILFHLAKYKDKIGVEVPIITNGTIAPSEDVLCASKEFGEKIRYIVDDYGELSDNVTNIAVALEQNGLRFEVRNYSDNAYCGGWVDLYGDYEKKHSETGAIDMFSKCTYRTRLKGVIEIIGGLIYFCPASRVFNERGLAVCEDEVVNFMDEPVDVVRQKISALFEKTSLAACAYCNGIHSDSSRHKPAEQLTIEDLKTAYLSNKVYRENV